MIFDSLRRNRSAARIVPMLLMLVAVAVAGSGTSWAQPLPPLGNWTQNTRSAGPPGRDNAAIAYDAASRRIVMFGGIDAAQRTLDDTWVWNGINATWQQRTPAAQPPARCCAAMAYDPTGRQVVLFGGSDTNARMLGDTWAWNGTTWTQLRPAVSPPPRDGAAMIYDDATGSVLLFGGLGADGNLLNDTWSWDGTTWTQLQLESSPRPRSGAMLVSDSDTQSAILFGGCCDMSANARPGAYLGDTWTWDGTTWTQLQPLASPPPRTSAAGAYDSILSSILLFGGCAPGDVAACRLNDTWLWDSIGGTWSQQQPLTSPPGRTNAAMPADGASRTLFLFGGLESDARGNDAYGGDSWTWIGQLPRGEP